MANKHPEATGYSTSFDFTEAFEDAVNNLPPAAPVHPGPGRNIVVVSIGTYKGGTRVERGLAITLRADR
jgi:hypothetical protein